MELEKNVRESSVMPLDITAMKKYSLFAEQYLEKPIEISEKDRYKFSVTVCTWRSIPTIDDW